MSYNETSGGNLRGMSQEDLEKHLLTQDFPGNITKWQEMSAAELTVKILFCAVIMIVSLVGNSLVLVVLLKKKSLRNVTNMFIVNLAVADLMVTLSTTWIHLVDDLSVEWVLGPVLCKYDILVQVMAFFASVFTMAAISTERFFGIVTPFMFCSFKKEKVSLAVAAIWLIAITVAIPHTVFAKQQTRKWRNYEEVWCHVVWPSNTIDARKHYLTVLAAILYLLPMVIMTCAYTAIIVKLRARQSEITELNSNSQSNMHSSRKRVVMMLILLLAVFTVCWLPFQVVNIYYEYALHGTRTELPVWWNDLQFGARLLADANSAFNPLIFIGFSQKIRKAIRGLLCKKDASWKRSNTLSSRANSLRSSTRRTWI